MTVLKFDRLARLPLTDLLKEMKRRTRKLAIAWQRIPMEQGLTKLIAQSEKPLALRDHDEIKNVWREIHGDLRQYNILQEFDQEPMRTSLLTFLKGKAKEPRGPETEL